MFSLPYMLSLALASASPALSPPQSYEDCTPKICKAYPGSSDWPSGIEWNQLNNTLNGRLLQPSPPAGICHIGQKNYNATQCVNLPILFKSFDFHLADPVSINADQFTNYSCSLNPKASCSSQGYPAYVINATCARDVRLGLDFARYHNLRLIVRSTGHDFLGRSIAPGSLSIWVHYLKAIKYHMGNYRIGSGRIIHENSVTVGSGVEMREVYSALGKYGQTIVGGYTSTVSVGGYLAGGGHSTLSPKYGLGADNIIEMEVVTPDGAVLTVNQDQHQQLFWALRGGGGSTFGIIITYTIRTFPSTKMLAVNMEFSTTPNDPAAREFAGYFTAMTPYMMEAGIYGYSAIFRSKTLNGTLKSGVSGHYAMINQTESDFYKAMQPIDDTIKNKWPSITPIYTTKLHASFLDWTTANPGKMDAGNPIWVVSRLLDRDTLIKNNENLTSAMWNIAGQGIDFKFDSLVGTGVQNADIVGGSNSVHPAWRKAEVHALIFVPFERDNKTIAAQTAEKADTLFEPIRKMTPDAGAYVNEAFVYEKNWQQTFWGNNYAKLLEIKRSVDPHDVLWCYSCVGSESWRQREDGKLCKV